MKALPAFGLGALLRGEADVLEAWMSAGGATRGPQALVIFVGVGAFGAAMGGWRAPEQALWSAVKLPIVLLSTAAGNAAINGMIAPLLGIDLRWRDSLGAVLSSFALAAAILGRSARSWLFWFGTCPHRRREFASRWRPAASCC